MRGVVIAQGVHNGPSPAALLEALRSAEVSISGRLNIDALAENPRLKSWREAYRALGAKPSEFRPSFEALARRVLHGNPLPSINALVDIGTVVSLNHLVPAGGHAIDMLKESIELRFASGQEDFIPFGSESIEHADLGEIIFAEGNKVLTRRWTWRQAAHTSIQTDTQAIEFNVDGLPPVDAAEVEQACNEIADLIKSYCGGDIRQELLSQGNPRILLTSLPD